MPTSPAVLQLHRDLSDDLNRIAQRFKNPKITLVVRAPQLEDGDVVMTNDDLDEAINAIERLKARQFNRSCGSGKSSMGNEAKKAVHKLHVVSVARICHEANRAYCFGLGDRSQELWGNAPQWQQESAVKGVRFHVEHLAKGRAVPPSASHDSWLEEKRAEGWKYGPVKDPEKKEHPCFVPYEQLPAEQRAKDYLFGAIVEALWNAGMIEV